MTPPVPALRSRALAVFVPVLLLAAAGGCASPWKRENLYSRDGILLYREHEEAGGIPVPRDHAHPAQVSPEAVASLLGRLVYVRTSLFQDPANAAVFRPEEVAPLARAAADSLERLGPHERLRFLVVRSSLWDAVTGTTGVSGIIFATRDGKLHVAFDTIAEGIDEGEGGDPDDARFPYDPTEYREASRLVTFPGAHLHRDPETGRLFPRWLEVDLEALHEAPAAAPEAAAGPAPAPESPALSPPEKPAPAAPGSPSPAAASSPAPPPAPAPPAPPGEGDLARRLRTLERLREEGLITEDEYRKKRQEILDEL